MATIVTRAGKGSPLTNTEFDSNFTNLNDEKVEGQIGTDPNEIPLNQFLGGMAYQDPANVVIGGGRATLTSLTATTVTGTSMVYNGAELSARLNPLAQAIYVQMTAATSGSNGIQVLNNANLDMGTNNFTVHWEGSLPTWAPTGSGSKSLVGSSTGTGIAGFRFNIDESPSGFLILLLRNTVSTITLDSTVAVSLANAAFAKLTATITREKPSVAGAVVFYVNGVQLGNSVAITAGTPISVSSLGSLYISGSNTERTSSNTANTIIYNRALSATEVLDLSINGVALADRGASQTNLITGDSSNFEGGTVGSWAANTGNGATSVAVNTVSPISGTYDLMVVTNALVNSGVQLNIGSVVAGKKYRLVFDYKAATSNAWNIIFRNNANPASGSVWADTVTGGTGWQPATAGQLVYEFTASLTTGSGRIHILNSVLDTIQLDNFVFVNVGLVSELLASNAQSNTGQIFDTSGNKNHALLPASGATVVGRPVSQTREVRWTNTWAGTNELQYIGGVNQAIIPANAYIESIIGTVSGATPHDIIVGDGSDADRYVTITTGLAAGTTTFTLANRTTDGTNLKLTVDPDTDATMSIAWVIRYSTLEA